MHLVKEFQGTESLMEKSVAKNNGKKEIVFVHPSLMGGGAERVALALASYFVQRGFSFTFLLTKSPVVEYDVPKGVNVVTQYAAGDMKPWEQIALIRRFVKKRPGSVVISFLPYQNIYTLMATRGLSNKVIVSVRNDPKFDFPGSRALPLLRNTLYAAADHVVFQTEVQRRQFPHQVSRKGCVILNPISQSIPEPYRGGRRKAIVTSGRLEEQKNHEMTIRAFALFGKNHPDYTLEIFGKGSELDSLKSLVSHLGIDKKVKFMGFSSDAVEHVRTASVFVMSSHYEGLSNSMIEALCMGVPTVCTRCLGGGAEAVIQDGVNGRLIDIDDVEGEALALSGIVDSSIKSMALSQEAYKLRDDLAIEKIGQQWLVLL